MSDGTYPASLDAVIESARPLAQRFWSSGHRLYLVGGVVRDHLVGRVTDQWDVDVTTDARPEQIKAAVADLADAVWTQGERFGTIGCTIAGRTYEITTHRADAYGLDSRKPAVSFGAGIEDDLARRDFTVNAMAIDLDDRALIDPYGGRADLAAGILRTPLDPEISFSEDPLRMLRAARFHAAYDLTPEPGLIAAITAMAGRMEIVSVERIRDELQKLLMLDDPSAGLVLLADTGLLAQVLVMLPAVSTDEAARLGQRVAALPYDPAMRWAALLLEPMSDAAVVTWDLRALKFPNRLVAEIAWLGSLARIASGSSRLEVSDPTARTAARRAHKVGRRAEEGLEFLRVHRLADGLAVDDLDEMGSRLGELRSREPDLDAPTPLLTGEEVCAALAIEPGPEVGTAMRWLLELRNAEGPLHRADARRRLVQWWTTRAEG